MPSMGIRRSYRQRATPYPTNASQSIRYTRVGTSCWVSGMAFPRLPQAHEDRNETTYNLEFKLPCISERLPTPPEELGISSSRESSAKAAIFHETVAHSKVHPAAMWASEKAHSMDIKGGRDGTQDEEGWLLVGRDPCCPLPGLKERFRYAIV